MEQPSKIKTLGECMAESKARRMAELENRLYEVENWILDNPYTHPDFHKMVEERNNISTQLNLV